MATIHTTGPIKDNLELISPDGDRLDLAFSFVPSADMAKKIREMQISMAKASQNPSEDANTIVGQPITTPDGVTLIPISKVSFGFGSGGADYGKVQPKDFGGAAGAGVKIDPVAFLVIKDGLVRTIQLSDPSNSVDRALNMLPELVDKILSMLPDKADKAEKAEAAPAPADNEV